MKNNIYFKDIPDIDTLYIEHVFVEFEQEPILFMCSDKEDTLYLCLCSELRSEQKWLISKCSVETLKGLIDEKLDVMTAMCLQKNLYVVERELSGTETSYCIETRLVDMLDLPEEGVYLRCNKEKANNYLWSKQLLILSKSISNLKPIMDSITKNYSVAFNESFQIASRNVEIYADAISKNFLKQMEIFAKEAMIIKNEYNLIMNKVEENDLKESVDDDYIQAA